MSTNLQKAGKKVSEVLETKDYSIFKKYVGNREVKKQHVNYLASKMKKNGWMKTSSVVVNTRGEIIDGQHRLMAAQIAKVPVQYTIVRGAGSFEITEMNTGQRNWTPFDHLNKFVSQGDETYIRFEKFHKDFPMFNFTELCVFLGNRLSTIRRDNFERGEFQIVDEAKAREMATNVVRLKDYYPSHYNKSIFVRAIVKVFLTKSDVFDFEEFLHKVSLRPSRLVPCGTLGQYIEMIEDIYNYRRTDKVNLRF
jgi:hypothetical protein